MSAFCIVFTPIIIYTYSALRNVQLLRNVIFKSGLLLYQIRTLTVRK